VGSERSNITYDYSPYSNQGLKMTQLELPKLLAGLHDDIEFRLKIGRDSLAHPTDKGDASEAAWLSMLGNYLPKRYQAARAHVIDSEGNSSRQIDVLIFDRQYSPFIFKIEGGTYVPAESVYAVFEVKQTINSSHISYAQDEVASVRELHRTSLPIPHAGGTYPPKTLSAILGGLLTFESEWKPPLGDSLLNALDPNHSYRLDLSCVASHGLFSCDAEGNYTISPQPKAATAFLFELIARLQSMATVPMIDVRAYARWLT
jgi:hypothetical protein